jgi:hypothetical protein
MNLPRFAIGILSIVAWSVLNFQVAAQPARSSDLGLQEWCSDQAKRLFKQLGLGVGQSNTYRSHYNASMHICFMALESHQGTAITKTLLDAYAQRTYASYFSMANADSLKLCVLMPPTNQKRTCDSDREYEAFVTHYIQH